MCRKKSGIRGCVLLDADVSTWCRTELVPAPQVVLDGFEHFKRAVEHAAKGDVETARACIARLDSDSMRTWYVEHAQVAGQRRVEILGTAKPRSAVVPTDKLKYPTRTDEAALFARDGYTCRYCRRSVVSGALLNAFSTVVGPAYFPLGRTNATTHGAALVYRAVADHVVPRWAGGRTDRSNLVTACYPCNFGKAEFTLDQLQLDPPRGGSPRWGNLEMLRASLIRQVTAAVPA